jgi:hypothetical protein
MVQLGASSLWLDEAAIWEIGRGSLADTLSENALVNSAPPTYPLLVKLAGAVLGSAEGPLGSVSLAAGPLALLARWLWHAARSFRDRSARGGHDGCFPDSGGVRAGVA